MSSIVNQIKENIVNRKLGEAFKGLDELVKNNLSWGINDDLKTLMNNYELMLQSTQLGMIDPSLEENYNHLLHSAYRLFARAKWYIRKTQNQFGASRFGREPKINAEYLYVKLEMALADDIVDIRNVSEHQMLRDDLFNSLINQELWDDTTVQNMENIIFSETIDDKDKQLIVTAVTLSAIGTFDINKVRMLIDIYLKSDNESIKQSALVGWVMSLDNSMNSIFPEQKVMVSNLLSDDLVQEDLAALQLQIIFCLNASRDHETIENEILPDIKQSLNIPNIDIKILEDPDEIEDFIERHEHEERLEQLQDKVERMLDMQKKGSDIYFGGFAAMKNYGFFRTLSNWFCPFYTEHPELATIFNHDENDKIISNLLGAVPFCDSDKYSFALSIQLVLKSIPKHMLSILGQGEIKAISEMLPLPTDAMALRNYLQNLYRFFRICPMKSKFVDIFTPEKALFISNPLFAQTKFSERTTMVAKLLYKKHLSNYFDYLAENTSNISNDFLNYIGNNFIDHDDYESAIAVFETLLEKNPSSKNALRGLGKCYFHEASYAMALEAYKKLTEMMPNDKKVELNKYICMSYTEDYDEAFKQLSRLNYETPHNKAILSALAWTYIVKHLPKMAVKKYEEVLTCEGAGQLEHFYAAIGYLCDGELGLAVEHFAQYFQVEDSFDYIKEVIHNEIESILEGYNITELQENLVTDLIMRKLNEN